MAGGKLQINWPPNWGTIFKKNKLPSWVLFLWAAFIFIPNLRSSIDFWWDASFYLGGRAAMIAGILTSPWFGLILIIAGVAYLVLVDESEKPKVGTWVSILGWGLVGLIFLAVVAISIISYVSEQVGPRHIFPSQEAAIRHVLTNKAVGFKIDIISVASCFDCDGYAEDFDDLIASIPGWSTIGPHVVLGPNRKLVSPFGITIVDINPSAASKALSILVTALTEAKIPFGTASFPPQSSNQIFSPDAQMIISSRRKR